MSNAGRGKRIYIFTQLQYISIDKGGETMFKMNPVYPGYVPEMGKMPCQQFPQQPMYEEQMEEQMEHQQAFLGAQPQPFAPQMPYMGGFGGCGCGCGCQQCAPKRICVSECAPIITCSKSVVEDYHIVKQPHIHIHNTEIVHHHMKCDEFIPQQTCCEKHVMDNCGCNQCNPCNPVNPMM
jgi:hypothetical protein